MPAPEFLLRVADQILDSEETIRVTAVLQLHCLSTRTPHYGHIGSLKRSLDPIMGPRFRGSGPYPGRLSGDGPPGPSHGHDRQTDDSRGWPTSLRFRRR